MTKDEILSFIYLDPAGYGSVAETYKEARKKDKTITMQDVKEFISKHQEQKKQLRGYNSFIAHKPKEEYQVDLFFIPKKDFPNEVYTGGVIAIDIFTKFISIVPIKSKTIPEILDPFRGPCGSGSRQACSPRRRTRLCVSSPTATSWGTRRLR
jgi:hypothetical protein